MRRRIRVFLWRYRFVLATALVTLAALAVVSEFRPAPAGEPVLVAATDLPAGDPIRANDVSTAMLPSTPAGVAADPAGLTPIVTIPAGVPITESMLLGPGLADHAPAGTVLAPIHVSDPSVLSLLRVGDRVDLYMSHADLGAGDSGAKLVSSDVQVMAFPSEGGSGGGFLSLDESNDAMFFGAIARRDANLFTGSSGLAPFRVVLTTAQD
ncbi:MAG TPA: SAF domain-containing protein [Beutenbergiaceae bacterium]|nr:SAF domain-containing protein [Beutenbergiaceae bacterium]